MKAFQSNLWSLKKQQKIEISIKNIKLVFYFKHKQPLLFPMKSKTILKPLKVYLIHKPLKFQLAASSTLISDNNTPLQVLTKRFRTSLESRNDPNISEMSSPKNNPFEATIHIFQFFKKLYHKVLCTLIELRYEIFYNSFTEYINQYTIIWNVPKYSNCSNCHTFMLSTVPASFPAFSALFLAPLIVAATYCLSSTYNNHFHTNESLNPTLNPFQSQINQLLPLIKILLHIYLNFFCSYCES